MSYNIEELKHDLNLAEDEIADHLYTIDYLRDKVERLEDENRDWEGVAECARERAEEAEDALRDTAAYALTIDSLSIENLERAEEAEYDRDMYFDDCNILAERLRLMEGRAEKAEAELRELKKALLTLGGDR